MRFFWKNNTTGTTYLFPCKLDSLGCLLEQKVLVMNIVITYDLNGNYGPVVYYGDEPQSENMIRQTLGKELKHLVDYIQKNNLILGEFDLVLADGLRIRTFYGNDVLIEGISNRFVIEYISQNFIPEEAMLCDKCLYRINGKRIQPLHYLAEIEPFLFENETLFFQGIS